MAKLLVTGGLGFIGSNFIRYWLKEHSADEIVNLDAVTYAGNPANLADVAKNPHYHFIKGDIIDPAVVKEAIAGVETVVHFAAESHVDRSITGPAAFVQSNVVGTQVLLDAAVAHKIKRFHHISTDEVFGSLPLQSERRFSERSALKPRSPYAASKAASDLLVRAYHTTYGLNTTITNTSNNYGPYQYPEKLIPLMTINALLGQSLPVYGDGQNIRDWIFVDDHCRGIDLVLQKGRPGETYCLGGDAEMANLTVVKEILRLVGRDESLIKFVPDRPGHDRRYALDSAKATALGFSRQHDFATGLAATVRWYQQHREWWAPLLNDEYKQYYQQQYGPK